MKRLNKIIGASILSLFVLTACSSEPAPEPTASPTSVPQIERPAYDADAASTPPFTINGSGNADITIDFPAGFREPSIVTVSATGEIELLELNYDGEEVGQVALIRSKKGGETLIVKYPSADSPARTSDFRVEANEDVSWAISAESLGSVQKISQSSISGSSSKVFMYDNDAQEVNFITKGKGTTRLYLIDLNETEITKLPGGIDSRMAIFEAGVLENLAGYIFVVITDNPDTQTWELLFTKDEPTDDVLVAP